jgi:hemoglobin
MRSIVVVLMLCLGVANTARAETEQTLFDEIGGGAILRATVAEFVDIMLEDERINFAFAQADLNVFKRRLYTQLCVLANGPCRYEGRDMKTAHEKLTITNAQFNAVAEDLYKAFERVGVNYRAQNKMMALLAPMQREIVDKKPAKD